VSLLLWLCAAAALAACEAAGRCLDHGWPTSAQLLRALRAQLPGRVVLIMAWVWLGWHTFAR
jgi:hypothetical protein